MMVLEAAQKMGSWTYRVNIPGVNPCFVGHHDLAREILMDKLTDKHGPTYKNIAGPKPLTMFTSVNSDPYMKAVRKSTAHAFSSREVGRMNEVATKYVNGWMNGRLKNLVEQQETFDPAVEFNRITFKVICEAAFEYIATDDEFALFEHHAKANLSEHTVRQSIDPIRKTFWFLYPRAREARRSLAVLLEFAGKVLDAYRQKPLKERSTNNTLIKILHDNPAMKYEHQRQSEVLDWLVAGHDTTGFSLANLSVLVAKHHNVQDKLRQELAKTQSSQDCDYFKKVVKETLRVVPTAAGGSIRVTGRDFHVKQTGEVVPKGTVCFTNQYLMNHNPSVYGPDVAEFIPERWDVPTEEMKLAMAPFSVGTRNCPGQSLAMAEINNTFPRLLSKFNLELVEEGSLTYFLTLKYEGSKILAKKL
mmetsp:Transcript_24919/g.59169  ORF Transcript_24919/g.59169 Transcript_24919/m.59169 type:complete len:418 (-) Transcript_24919:608-1861(-)